MSNQQTKLLVRLAAVLALLVFAVLNLGETRTEESEEEKIQWEALWPDFSAQEVVGLRIDVEDGAVRLDKSGGEWHLSKPLEVPADERKVSQILDSLSRLQVSPPLEMSASSTIGLAPPLVAVSIDTAGGQTLRLGLGSKSAVQRWQYVLSNETVRLSQSRIPAHLTGGADAFRAREAIRFSRSAVLSVKLEDADGILSVQRDGAGWRLAEDTGEVLADPEAIDALLSTLLDLRVDAFDQPIPTGTFDLRLVITTKAGSTGIRAWRSPEDQSWLAEADLHSGGLKITPGLSALAPSGADEWRMTEAGDSGR